ncbi:MAG: cytochrome c [Gammaproteobacteria bacterium]|nr:cytochrome c [Gammaproteobacteria bacterium]MCW8840458.1 cytochrome c [Gammaproteobacteria bacterium]MCW8927264.1 cytochrome c [Gammaproteobacteria bacterium]MCW8957829.1 cytochrome c [Gammaproteobacteria bacterium]MCW8973280.1 cytochrome c [Gammaproteobacteria bacterium]
MKKTLFTAIILLPLLSACSEGNSSSATQTQVQEIANEVSVNREVDMAKVARGSRLYQMNCAECHGSVGQGAPNWRERDADGMFPPPPLNGTGHAWHHPKRMLHYVIANGSPGGQGKMPAWGDKLNDEEIDAIIEWFISRWPDQVYAAWHQMDRRRGQGG